MKYTYKCEAGDWSADGHGRSETYYFTCSHDKTEILAAYRKAVLACGISLRDRHYDNFPKGTKIEIVCGNYEDNVIREDQVEKLVALGINFDDDPDTSIWETCIEGDDFWASSQDLATLFLEMVKTQLEGFTYKFTTEEVENIFQGFGYGCFHM